MKDNNKERTGVVLLNLGGPDSPEAVRPFLYNLFSDREIIRLGPSFLQKPLAWLISSLRSSKTKKMYGLIGGKSPILDITTAQADSLEKTLTFDKDDAEKQKPERNHIPTSPHPRVYIGMRYWHPFIKDTVQKIIDDGIKHLVVLSMYPHYSKATTGSALSEFKERTKGKEISIQYIEQWYDFPAYINALAYLVAKGLSEFDKPDVQILYSAHGLPESFIREGDPYLDHIKSTIKKVNERLSTDPYNIPALNWHLSFQSRTGPVKWLEPATEETIVSLAQSGCRNLLIVPISFVSDHIETLYEIDILYKELSKKNSINLKRCESLNTSGKFILALRELIMSKINRVCV